MHKGKKINKGFNSVPDNIQYTEFTIPAGKEFRPDLISNEVYGKPSLWKVFCVFNGILNPFKELVPGKTIKIPIIK